MKSSRRGAETQRKALNEKVKIIHIQIQQCPYSLCLCLEKFPTAGNPPTELFAASLRVSIRGASRREAGRSPANSYFRSATPEIQ
ncbi:hypothetical protein [Nostoc sp. MG11]|uniref:hypothetical protein n=1 Tax=Nostoc sp. MG11 TaxID=2721166 RepID=UPI0018680B2B|nr:hypothetical protein [Nostoc sp. MG11]